MKCLVLAALGRACGQSVGVCAPGFSLIFVFFCSFKPSMVSAAAAVLAAEEWVLIPRDSDVELL